MIVDGKVVVEVKASADVRASWGRQLQTDLTDLTDRSSTAEALTDDER